MRDGGMKDPTTERLVQDQTPAQIVMKARTTMERLTTRPLQILGGQWSRCPVAGRRPIQTGNFTYTFAGHVPYDTVTPFAEALIEPLRVGRLVQGDKWTWAQLRGVPTKRPDGSLWNNAELTRELQRNPTFCTITLCMPAHWHGNIANMEGKPSATVVVAFVDKDGALSRDIGKTGVHMYGVRTPFVVLGDNPRFMQCGRCHLLGHSTEMCQLKASTLKCYICGGGHAASQHARFCNGSHAIAGRCTCKFRCLLCGKMGHHTRSHDCPKRGRFPAVPLETMGEPVGPTDPPPQPNAETDDLIPTQRTPRPSDSTLPVHDLRQLSKGQRARRKGRKNQPLILAQDPQPPTNNPFTVLDPLDIPAIHTAQLRSPDLAPLNTQEYTDWMDDKGDDYMQAPPLYNVFTAATLPTQEEVRAHYLTAPFGTLTESDILDEAEIGWGGTPGQVKECVSLLSRYALKHGFPMTRTESCLRVAGNLFSTGAAEVLRREDERRGGDGTGTSLMPLYDVLSAIGKDVVLVENRMPPNFEATLHAFQACDPSELTHLVEDFDFQVEGDGDGSGIAATIRGGIWDTHPGLFSKVQNTWTVPNNSSTADVAQKIESRWDWASGPPPAPIHFFKLVTSYMRKANCGTTAFTTEILADIAATHAPYSHVANGLPWYRNLSPPITRRLQEAAQQIVPARK